MRIVRVFISSPGDVQAERRRIERVVDRLNGELADGARFQAIRWEKSFYTADRTFQDQIPEAADCDIVVAMLRHQLGTELPDSFPRMPDGTPYPSGTAYEVLSAVQRRRTHGAPDVYVFRYAEPPLVRLDDPDAWRETQHQWARVKGFFERWFQTPDGRYVASFHTFASTDDLETQIEAMLSAWIEERLTDGRAVRWPVALKGSPFRGLGAFGAKHAPVFFGRARDRARAASALKDAAARGTPFLLIIGPSGSGKSSLARAGLVPDLTAPGVVDRVDVWRVACVRPGEHVGGPFAALAAQLFKASADLAPDDEGRPPALPELADGPYATPADLAGLLSRADTATVKPLMRALDQVAQAERDAGGYDRPVTARLLLAVDQLDELFAADLSADTRSGFAALLATLAATGRIWVIATLRADFYEACLSVRDLLALKTDGATVDLQPPGLAEIAEIVRAPAGAAGLTYEADADGRGLDERILTDAGRADMLPLVQFTLNRLFEARRAEAGQTRLTHQAYDAMGGLDGALNQEAERALTQLDRVAQAALPHVLRQLVTPTDDRGERGRMTARSVPLAVVAPDPPRRRLVDALIEARIVLSSDARQEPAVRLAHERVLESWRRAREIVAANADFFRIRQDVEDARGRWQTGGRRRDRLIPDGVALAEAEAIAAGFGDELSAATRAFINASSNRARRRQRLTAAAATVFLAVAVAAGYLGLLARQAQDDAVAARIEAEFQAERAEQAAADARQRAVAETAARLAAERQRALAEAAAAEATRLSAAEAAARREAEHALRTAADATNSLVFDLAQRFENLSVPSTVTRAILEEALRLQRNLAGRFPSDPGLQRTRALALAELGDIYVVQDDMPAALGAYEEALQIHRALVGPGSVSVGLRSDLSIHLDRIGDVRRAMGDADGAMTAIEEALAIRRTLIDEDPGDVHRRRDLSVSLNRLGAMRLDAGDSAGASAAFEESLEIRHALVDGDPDNPERLRDLSTTLERIGDLRQRTGDADGALDVFLEGLSIDRTLVDRDPHNTLWQHDLSVSLHRIGDVHRRSGDIVRAARAYQEAQQIRRALVDSDPENVQWRRDLSAIQRRLGDLHLLAGDTAAALGAYSDGLEIVRVLADRRPDTIEWRQDVLDANLGLGQVRAAQGDWNLALDHFLLALDDAGILVAAGYISADQGIVEEVQSRIQRLLPDGIAAYRQAAHQAFRAGRYDDATDRLGDALARLDLIAEGTETDAPRPAMLGNLAFFALFAERFAEARAAAEQALNLAPEERWIEANLAHALMFLGEVEAADALYRTNHGLRIGPQDRAWEDQIREDFASLSAAGIIHPHMTVVEEALPPLRIRDPRTDAAKSAGTG